MEEITGTCGTREEVGLKAEMAISTPGIGGSHPNFAASFPICEQLSGNTCGVNGRVCHVLENFRDSAVFLP